MSWLAPKLRTRVDICKSVQTPNSTGGFDKTYTTLTTIWAGIKESNFVNLFFSNPVRGEQVDDVETHEFTIRLSSMQNIGKAYASAFADGFDAMGDINPIKSEYFMKVKSGTYKGRVFKVMRVRRDDNYKAFIKIRAKEIEEYGTGWPS